MDPLAPLRDGDSPERTGLDEQTLYDLLANPRRRHIIEHVAERDEPTTKRQLAELVAALETDVDLDDITRADQQSAYVSLHQQHVPILQEHSLLEDVGDGELVPTDRCRQVAGIILAVRRLNGGGIDG